MVESGRVDLEPLIGERIALKDALKGFESAEKGETMKVVLEP
jgi:threonine dehydrogenase-like Zn-dependent dehydrogenase